MEILIIKLGAVGDVIRTLPIAVALKKEYPECKITWVTKKESTELFGGNHYVDEVVTIPFETDKSFDVLYNLEIEKEASDIALGINAGKKLGFYCEGDYPASFNPGAEYYINTFFDDELKKKNTRTYQEMMFEAAELEYNHEKCQLFLSDEEKEYGKKFWEENRLNGKKVIGIHMGASSRWPSKVWHEEKIKEFVQMVKDANYEILLFGGPNEIEKHRALSESLENEGIKIFRNNTENTKKQFASLVRLCNYMVCSDSFALHVSIALERKTIGLFFCTSANEVEGYGLLTKIVSSMQNEFFPERMNEYNEELTKSITANEVIKSIE